MPVWSKQEILKCRELMYSDIPVAVVQDCFRRWGGIARYVLQFAQVENQQVLLEEAIDIVDLDWYFVFASQYVQQEVYKRLYVKDKQKLLEFIFASDGFGALAVLRGHLFEGHVQAE
ncbi:hypothetical protein JG688_00001770 [Phytophthora aleatoria]|uniref:Uncharacterized protein n=1 Tax=Phytophthora aleatoria TaxID=2496075 RepID=A0A8J5MIW6_9STRA|nr:hypothetical protein JG688_00001770 [Phytophthora aleatoria]